MKFTKDYQPKEKWTEEKALKLGNELIEWLKDGAEKHVLFDEFLVINKGLYIDLLSYLKTKFKSFLDLYRQAKKIQEIKITKYGLENKFNSQMAKFILSATHGLTEKKEFEQKDITIKIEHSDKDTQELIDDL